MTRIALSGALLLPFIVAALPATSLFFGSSANPGDAPLVLTYDSAAAATMPVAAQVAEHPSFGPAAYGVSQAAPRDCDPASATTIEG